jgi:chromosome segregation ATPase
MPEGTTEAGDESVQLRRIADIVEVRLRKAEEVTAQATQALKQAQEEIIEQRRAAQQEKEAIQEKFDKDREKIQKEKEQLLAKQIGIEEAVNRAFLSVTGLEQKAEEPLDHQVMKLAEVIQQLQQRVMDLELQIIPSTPQEERDQREITARGTVERIKELTEECKQLSTRSAQIHENLTENPELHKLESQLQEVKQHADRLQMQLKALSTIEKMKRSHEQRVAQQQIHMIQSKVMEVTQQLQPLQDKACQLFLEIENQGTELQQVVITAEQHLEGPVNNTLIQEFTEQEEITKQQVEAARAKLEVLEAELARPE